jgi:hypothetical protein
MDTIFNILVIGFIGLIAYWWANQGLFSATIHFVCVLCAGALAFATWEPIVGILMSQKWLQPYAVGVALLFPFSVYLFTLRLLADKLAPDNLNFPQVLNLTVGGVVGAVAAMLTVGIALIGVGHLHSSTEVLGVVGAARTNGAKGAPDLRASSLWLPVHKWTGDTYAWLSEGSMSPSFSTTTLASLHPNLGEQALGLARDTFDKRGRIARTYAGPNSIRIDKAILVSDYSPPRGAPMRAYVVDVHLDPEATTEGQGFAISASQLRLIGPRAGTQTTVAYPIGWSQPNTGGGRTFYLFDDSKNYISGPAGTTTLDVTLVFPADKLGGAPSFLQAMGLRLPFPAIAQESSMADAMAMQSGGSGGGVDIPATVAQISSGDLTINDSIMPANANMNNLGAMEVAPDTNLLFKGLGDYESGGFAGNKSVVVRGIWAPEGTRVVRLNLTRGSRNSIDFWNDRSKAREEAGENAQLMLIDDLGRPYYPIGYIHAEKTGERRVSIRLEREGNYYKISSFPNLASSGADDLFALFTPAVGRTIVGVKLGDKWVARANMPVTPKT